MKRAYVVDAARTAVGKFGGTLASQRPDDLAAEVIKSLIDRNPSIDPSDIEDVLLGAANQAGEDNRNVARMSLLLAGLPHTVPGLTINRLCASSLQAIADVSKNIAVGYGDVYLAGGVESMSRAPFVLSKSETAFSRTNKIYDTSIGWRFINPKLSKMYHPYAMGETAENIVEKYQISRVEQDEFAHHSQLKYQNAYNSGKFSEEIIPISIPRKKQDDLVFNKDEHPRLSSVEVLSNLKPAFKDGGSVTAGNSSGVNDGSAALVIVSEDALKRYNLEPIAEVVSSAAVGVSPDIMGIGPVNATNKALKRAGISIKDIDLVELNEAFAAQSIACIRDLELNPEIINVNGGSIAIGHPLGASGARIVSTLVHEFKRRKSAKYALATMCVGVGQGVAVIFKKC
ncbi:MAG: Beta-ketoadipyl-CoA thiolase [Bacteroidia bacterium]|jgi:acetyl-CoA C-acetyltransferase|nr:MAG: Beta-ketoadipyl-CoA thiolase [Bacteroidia bacterium]